MFRKISVGALALLAFIGIARADEPIGGSYYQNNAATSSFTVISAAANANGLHVRSIVVSCVTNVWFTAVPPTTGVTPRLILACNPFASVNGVANLPTPMYLPAGYALQFNVGTGSSSGSGIYITYDLNAGP